MGVSVLGLRPRGKYVPGAAPPPWAASMAALTWTELPNTDFHTYGGAVIPAGSYIGSGPVDGIIDAYSSGVQDYDGSGVNNHGGGHANGTINGVIRFDFFDLTYTLRIPPTPPAKYPPLYAAGDGGGGPGVLQYPSGATIGVYPTYGFSSTLTNPLDTPYNAPQDAPNVQHAYASGSMSKTGKILWFYKSFKELDTITGLWSGFDVDLGSMLYAIDPTWTNQFTQQGTGSIYDEVTDTYFMSLVPGDAGINSRSGLMPFDYTTRQFVPPVIPVPTVSSMNLIKIGRYCWGLGYPASSVGYELNKAWRCNFDTSVIEWFQFQGDLITNAPTGLSAENHPACYHPIRNTLLRLNYQNDKNALYEINLTPVSGTGTKLDPYILNQTRIPLSGDLTGPVFMYRLFYYALGNCVMVQPRSISNWFAVKL